MRRTLCLLACFLGARALFCAAGEEEVFTIRVDMRLTANDAYHYERKFDDGFLAEKADANDTITVLFTGERKIRIVDQTWITTGSSTFSAAGGGKYVDITYSRTDPPDKQEVEWSYSTDPEQLEPTNSWMTANLNSKLDECQVTPTPDWAVKTTDSYGGQSGGQAQPMAGMLRINASPLHAPAIKLPTNTTTYSVSQTYSTNVTVCYTNEGESGQRSAQYLCTVTIQRNPALVEAVILPDIPSPIPLPLPTYEQWIPTAGKDEDEIGGYKMVAVILRAKGSHATQPLSTARAKFRVHLADASREPGLCMNHPSREEAKTQTKPDLRIQEGEGITVTDEGLSATTVNSDHNQLYITVGSYDDGAYGKLVVTADVPGQGEIRASVLDHPDQDLLVLPKDDNDNHVADAWETSMGVRGLNLAADSDNESDPSGQRSEGDGLSFYEEYRGFVSKGSYHRLDPHYKEFFIYDPDGLVMATFAAPAGTPNLYTAAGVIPYLIWNREWTGSGAAGGHNREVNFNTSGFAHITDQHATDIYTAFAVPNTRSGDPNQVSATIYPDESFQGPGGPGDYMYCRIRPWIVAMGVWQDVRSSTRGLPLFAPLDDPTISDADRKNLLQLLEQATGEYIDAHPADYARALSLRLSQIVTHELAHSLNAADHKPWESGNKSCIMRALEWEKPRDPTDRFFLRRRNPWPSTLCNDGGTCWPRIQVSDFPGKVAGASVAPDNAPSVGDVARAHVLGSIAEVHSLQGVDVAPLEMSGELAWSPVFAGDPVAFVLRLDELLAQQTLAGQLLAHPSVTNLLWTAPAISADWPAGMTLELVRLGTNQQRQVVLPAGDWNQYLRPPAFDWSAMGIQPTVYVREWAVPGTNASLTPGTYELTAVWNGQGLAVLSRPPGFTNLAISPLQFQVLAVTNAADEARHLGRLAQVAAASGDWSQVRSLGNQALSTNPTASDSEAFDTRMLTMRAALSEGDYPTVLRLATDAQLYHPQGETAGQLTDMRELLSPKLDLQWGSPTQSLYLVVSGLTGLQIISEQSTNLVSWSAIRTNVMGETEQVTLSNLPPATVSRRVFYRAKWEP